MIGSTIGNLKKNACRKVPAGVLLLKAKHRMGDVWFFEAGNLVRC